MDSAEQHNSFEGIAPSDHVANRFRKHKLSTGQKIVYGVVGLAITAIVVVAGLEICGVAIWPRHKDRWETITYKTFDSSGSSTKFSPGSSLLYYTTDIPEPQARRLGDLLTKVGFFDKPYPVSVMLTRREDSFVVSFFLAPDQPLDSKTIDAYQDLRLLSSETLENQPVIVELCEPEVQVYLDASVRKTVRKTLR